MLFLQWEARDWGWRTRTPAHPPRAARAGHPRGEESQTRTGLRDPAPEGFGQGQHSRPRRRWAGRNSTGAGGPRGGVPWNRGVSPWDCRVSPGRCRECLGRPRLPCPCRAEVRRSAQPSFLFSWVCESRGSRRRGSTSRHSLAHSCPREKPPARGRTTLVGHSVLSAALPR